MASECLSPQSRAIVGSCTPSRYHFPFCRCTMCVVKVANRSSFIRLQDAFCFSVLSCRLEWKLLLEKYSRICKLFPNFQDTPWSICATPAVRNVHSDLWMTHFPAVNSTKLDRCVGLCDVTNSADGK